MLNPELIMDRLDQIRISTNRLRHLASLKKELFLADPDNFAIAEHHLRRALEALLDIGRHILAKEGFGRPEDYKSIITSLGQHKVLPLQFANRIQGMAGYRNRLVHGYAQVTDEEIYEIINEKLDDFQSFANYILRYIKEKKSF